MIFYDASIEAEVIGTMAHNGHCRTEGLARLDGDCFTDPVCGAIFTAIGDLHASGTHIDSLTIKQRLPSGFDEARVDDVLTATGGLMGFAVRVDALLDYRAFRRLREGWEGIQGSVSAQEAATIMDQAVMDVRRGLNDLQTTAGLDFNLGDEEPGIPTGYSQLDMMLPGEGLQPGRMFVLAARPGMGKTALACNILCYMASRGYTSLFLSLEMTKKQLTRRLVKIDPAVEDYHQNIIVEDMESLGSGDLSRVIGRIGYCRDVHKVNMVFVDYLQLICAGSHIKHGRTQEMTFISRSLKVMALAMKLPLIAVAQLNRDLLKRTDMTPHLGDLRDSGQIEQDADIVGFLFQPDMDPHLPVHLRIAKNRDGRVTDHSDHLQFKFDKNKQQFRQLDGFKSTGYDTGQE